MQRYSQADRHSRDRFEPGYGAGYQGSQSARDEHALAPGYMQSGPPPRGPYDRDRDFAFQHNDDRNDGGYPRDVRHFNDIDHDRGGYSAYARDLDRGRVDDDRGRGGYNMYSRDVDSPWARRDGGQPNFDRGDFYARDEHRRDFDRGDFDRPRFDHGVSGGYADRGSFPHDRDFGQRDGGYGRGGYGRDDRGSSWHPGDRGGDRGYDRGPGYDSRSHGSYEGSRRFDDARMPMERRWR